ncbi:MAG TPA: response regulator, partial [Aggregatilineales bacterium]|nr:response regulator [Aggregatilineales bacterium]
MVQTKRSEPNYSHMRILVVDDEQRMVDLIRMNLEIEGFQVIEATNGVQALDEVRKHIPDLIILDIMMPQLDGFEVL